MQRQTVLGLFLLTMAWGVNTPVMGKPVAAKRPVTRPVVAHNSSLVLTNLTAAHGNQSITLLKQGIEAGKQTHYSQALVLLEQSAKLASPLTRLYPQLVTNLGQTWALIGFNALKLGQTDKAQQSFQKALPLLQSKPLESMRGLVCADLGRIYMLRNQLNKAKPLFVEAIRLGHEDAATLQRDLDRLSALPTPGSAGDVSTSNFLSSLRQPAELWDTTHRQLNIYVQPGPAHYTQEVTKAFSDWQQRLKGLFAFNYVTDPDQSDCQIIWTDKPDTLPEITEENHYASGHNTKTSMTKTIISNNIYLSLTALDGSAPSSADLYNTTLHEIGHMLGINGHSPSPGDVMVNSSPAANVRRQLTTRDVATLMAVYQSPDYATAKVTPANIALSRFTRYQQQLEAAGKLVQQKRLPEAQQLIEQAMTLYPNYPLAHVMLGDVYLRLDNYTKAKSTLAPWANSRHPYRTQVQTNFVIAQINETFALTNKSHWDLAKPKAINAINNLQVVLKQADLSQDMQMYLAKSQTALRDIANYQPGISEVISYGSNVSSVQSQTNNPSGKKKHWWERSGYSNQAPVYIPMPSRF